MKRITFLAMFVAMVLGASAQYQIHLWMDGEKISYPVLNLDSITFTNDAIEEPGEPDPGTPDTPEEPETPTASIGVFSVGEGKTVAFSPGNLQYHPANNVWQFAANQTDYIGDANSNISSTYNGWIDLFGWSTAANNFGVSTLNNFNDYIGSFVDWGTNTIGNDAPNTWRTLTYDEWNYLRYSRTNADDLCGVAQVNGVNGLIFLPDNWTCPAGITFKSGFHSEGGVDYYAAYQTFTADQWSTLEKSGAVFLPAAGYRWGSSVYYVQYYGYYWSATEHDSYFAYCLSSASYEADMYDYDRGNSQSVRLVKDIEGGGATPDTPDTPTEPEEPENTENNHEYVDLGLSVKWATCNVGANSPEEYGDYFAWGETQPKETTYNLSTYKWCNGSYNTLTKYCTNSSYGTVDNKTTLDLSDDAARANWGGAWRMPTDAELTELREQCTWTWTTQNGVNGYKVTSKKNGNSIFLPAAGYRLISSLNHAGSSGYYWSSSLAAPPRYAWYVRFGSDYVYRSHDTRHYGLSVRPVCQ